jgi:V/A-type H+-transporting ATPase subunit I
MYGMPVYNEFDPTSIVAPFYILFFAMCMGDAGYGLVLILFGLAVSFKWLKIDMFKNIGPLIAILGAGTLLVGLVLGTAFGINLAEAS